MAGADCPSATARPILPPSIRSNRQCRRVAGTPSSPCCHTCSLLLYSPARRSSSRPLPAKASCAAQPIQTAIAADCATGWRLLFRPKPRRADLLQRRSSRADMGNTQSCFLPRAGKARSRRPGWRRGRRLLAPRSSHAIEARGSCIPAAGFPQGRRAGDWRVAPAVAAGWIRRFPAGTAGRSCRALALSPFLPMRSAKAAKSK